MSQIRTDAYRERLETSQRIATQSMVMSTNTTKRVETTPITTSTTPSPTPTATSKVTTPVSVPKIQEEFVNPADIKPPVPTSTPIPTIAQVNKLLNINPPSNTPLKRIEAASTSPHSPPDTTTKDSSTPSKPGYDFSYPGFMSVSGAGGIGTDPEIIETRYSINPITGGKTDLYIHPISEQVLNISEQGSKAFDRLSIPSFLIPAPIGGMLGINTFTGDKVTLGETTRRAGQFTAGFIGSAESIISPTVPSVSGAAFELGAKAIGQDLGDYSTKFLSEHPAYASGSLLGELALAAAPVAFSKSTTWASKTVRAGTSGVKGATAKAIVELTPDVPSLFEVSPRLARALESVPIPKITKAEVPLLSDSGETKAVWKGLYLSRGSEATPILGKTSIPKTAKSIKPGFLPESNIETRLTLKTMEKLDYGEATDIFKNIRSVIKTSETYTPKSIDEVLPKATQTLNEKAISEVKSFLKENISDVEKIYGSYASTPQVKPQYRSRVPADIDVQLRTSPERAQELAQNLVDRLKKAGAEVRLSPDPNSPLLIESKTPSGTWRHAIDLHAYSDIPSPDVVPPRSWGFKLDRPPTTIEGLPTQRLSEQVTRKGVSPMGFRTVDDYLASQKMIHPSGAKAVVQTGDKYVGSAAHRSKDIYDFLSIQKSIIQDYNPLKRATTEARLTQIAKFYGVDYSKIGQTTITRTLSIPHTEIFPKIPSPNLLGSIPKAIPSPGVKRPSPSLSVSRLEPYGFASPSPSKSPSPSNGGFTSISPTPSRGGSTDTSSPLITPPYDGKKPVPSPTPIKDDGGSFTPPPKPPDDSDPYFPPSPTPSPPDDTPPISIPSEPVTGFAPKPPVIPESYLLPKKRRDYPINKPRKIPKGWGYYELEHPVGEILNPFGSKPHRRRKR